MLKETLENRGVMGQMRARMRAEVFHSLDDQLESRPTLSSENMLINELIREYLEFNHYKYSLSVLMAETGQPKTPLDRSFLTNELNIQEDSDTARLPLLYGVLSHFLESKGPGLSMKPRKNKDTRSFDGQRSDGRRQNERDVSVDMHVGEPVILSGTRRR
ncbi:centrosomal protein 20-like isoform X3 [Apostichopus japonicus]|uniref:centrosomal protein 20-like isoform X2 n=1 Tax=Stichopus japonicus TaxID=307972 RepID=UPI003AB8548A